MMHQYIEKEHFQIFDQELYFSSEAERAKQAQKIANTILQVSQMVIDFSSVLRVPRYCENRRESNVEHSFMVGLSGAAIVSEHYPGLDSGLTAMFGMVHDLPELKTKDVCTFDITDEDLAQKHANDMAGMHEILPTVPPLIADLIVMYEEQVLPEARLINHLDKPHADAVNITGAGLAVMHEDFNVFAGSEYMEKSEVIRNRLYKKFPEPAHEPLHRAHEILATSFAATLE